MISKIHPKAEIEKITIKPGIRALNAAAILLGTESGICILNFSTLDVIRYNSVATTATIIAKNNPCTPV